MTPSPVYVEYGSRSTAPPPFSFEEGRFRGYLLKGDARRVQALCDLVLNGPASGKVTYAPMLGGYVLLQAGHFGRIRSQDPAYKDWGYAEESQLSIFIPVLAKGGGEERVCMFCPYMVVDNPVSMAGGREIYGYPKSLGRFSPEDALGDPLRVEAFGGDFDPNHRAEWRQLFTVRRADSSAAAAEQSWLSLEDTVPRVGSLERLEELAGLDLGAIEAIIKALFGKSSLQVFLKQFRDEGGGPGACFQKVVEAKLEYVSTSISPSLEEWEVVIEHLDSEPIAAELGISSPCRTRATFDARMEVNAPGGHAVAP
jgi:Acetoacetate decarboxylase (ADC)